MLNDTMSKRLFF